MFRFHKGYFLLTILLFFIEVLIALYVRDRIVRPYVGDFLVVILIYYFVQSFRKCPVVPLAIGVLLFAYAVEVLQYFNLVDRLGLGRSKLALVILGSSFEWIDLVAYTTGIVAVVLSEKYRQTRKTSQV
ncbi:MAG TPA: DUF2809 domain-containing protein [Flavisolibacter sp.]|jgi:hypothetical protein|nr:DUF2809 domain-containing protein [Flavisolibacter sp.]